MRTSFVVMVALLAIGSVHAGVVFSDNFENVAPVAFPDTTVDGDPVAQVGSWTNLTEQDSAGNINHGIQVTGSAQENQYLGVQRVSGGHAYVVASFTEMVTSTFTLEYDFRLVDSPSKTLCLYLQNKNAFTGWTGEAIAVNFESRGWMRSYSNNFGASTYLNGEFADGQWTHVKFSIDFDSRTFSMAVGNNTVESFAFNDTNASSLGNIIFYSGAGGTEFYLDNIVVTPEPVSLVLLGLGGFVLRVRKPN